MADIASKALKTTSRRQLLRRAALACTGLGAATFGYTWRVEPHWIEVVRRTLPIALLPEALVGKTLIQISDLHIGPVVDEAYMSMAMQRVSALGADILAITGDFMTCDSVEQVDAVQRVIKHLRPGKLATVGILGNHDYGISWASSAAANLLTSNMRNLGITMLRNERVDVQGLQIAGVDDYWGPNFQPKAVMPQLDPQRANLLLCHNPDALDLTLWSGYRGWVLSGHTHGGQCKIPFLFPPVIPVKNKRYTSGQFDLFDGRMLYINRGLGYLHRVRFDARPEITVFTLARQE